jgi:hypothetical protein
MSYCHLQGRNYFTTGVLAVVKTENHMLIECGGF